MIGDRSQAGKIGDELGVDAGQGLVDGEHRGAHRRRPGRDLLGVGPGQRQFAGGAPAQARFQGLGGAPTTCSRRLILPTSTKSGSTRISGVAMILIPGSGRAVVKSQGHPGNAGSIEGM